MKPLHILSFFCLFLVHQGKGQEVSYLDSLKSALNQAASNQATLSEIRNQYYLKNLDSLIKYGDLALVQNVGDSLESAIFLQRGNFYLAERKYDLVEKTIDTLNGYTFVSPKLKTDFIKLQARFYGNQQQSVQSLLLFYQALDIAKQASLEKEIVSVNLSIGHILKRNRDYENAVKIVREAYILAEQIGDFRNEIRSAIIMCEIYNSGENVNLDSSYFYGKAALEVAENNKYEFGVLMAVNYLSAPTIRKGFFEEGLTLISKAEALNKKYNRTNQFEFWNTISKAFAYLGLNQIPNAEKQYEKALKLNPDHSEIFRLKYSIEKQQKNYLQALIAHEKYEEQKSQISYKNHERQISGLEARLQAETNAKEVKNLSQQASIQALEIKQKNQGIIIGIVVVLFILLAIYFLYKQRESRKEQLQTELEQRFLRSQLNPHFVSNALVSVQNFMFKNDGESATLYLAKFSKLMREILENSRREFIPVEEEIGMLRNYLDIHKLRLKTFDYTIDVSEEIDPETDTIPPMFVQPFLENAIEHGIGQTQQGKIDLKFRKEQDYIAIEIKDNGDGFKVKTKTDRISLSSTIIKERIDLFNKTLKNKIKLEMDNLKDEKGKIAGAKVALKVPFSYI